MGYKKSYSSDKKRDAKPKRSFRGKNSERDGGAKPAFKKRFNGDKDFSKDKDEKRSFRSRPDDRERKPFRRPDSKFSDDKRRGDSKPPAHSPRNPRWEARPDWKKANDKRATATRDSRSDDRERKSIRKPDTKFVDDARPKWQDRNERTSGDDARPPRTPYSRDSRPDDRERKSFRRPESGFGDESKPTYPSKERGSEDRPERESEDNTRAPRARYSRDARSDNRERKPYRKTESSFGDRRASGIPFKRDDRSGDGEKKWNRKSDSEFYGDRRKSAPRGRVFDKRFERGHSALPKRGAGGEANDGLIRLNKFISNAGICSRREADEMIEAGVVSVNGEVITQLGYKVKPDDVVKYNNEVLRSEKMVYLLLNKPKDFITTADDPEKRKTVMTLIANACKERVYPVGRLDRNTTGLLLMTNDGDLTRKLTHPSFEVQKIYQVELDKALKPSDMEEIERGIHLNDGSVKVDAINYVGTGQDKSVIGIELHSGKNRIVRRIFEQLGYEVKKLDRVYFAGISKKDLPRGRWRFLTELEVASLKIMTGSKKFKNLAPVEEERELE